MIELMLVVMIIGVMAMLIGPGIGEFIADARAAGAAEELVRLQRYVRARVEETGLAHLMQYDGTASNNLGRITVWEGMNNHCTTTPWNVAITNGAVRNQYPIEVFDMAAYNPTASGSPDAADHDRHVIRLTAKQNNGTDTVAAVNLCYQPSGLTLQGTTGASWTFLPHKTTIKFSITRTVNSVPHGMIREVLYPPGGNARLRI